MKKKSLAVGAAVLTVAAGMFSASSGKTVPTVTTITPPYTYQGLSPTVTITGSGFAKNTSLVVNGTAYPLKINSANSATFTFTPSMTANVGNLSLQLKTANLASQSFTYQVCEPIVITTTSIPMTVGVPIGPEGQIQFTGGCKLV